MIEEQSPPVIEAHTIVKTFGPVVAVDGADIELRSGKITALVGNNGAGKSTLAKILGGALEPDEGAVAVDGRPVRFRNPAQARSSIA
jgi:fructose transport system ATP-binding protein